MRRLLTLLTLLGGPADAVPTPPLQTTVQASGHYSAWIFEARPGGLVARHNGGVVWQATGPFARPTGLQLWVTPRRVILVSSDGAASNIFLTAYDLPTGRRLWQNRLLDYVANASARIVTSTPETLIVQASSGEPMFGRVYGLDVATGKTRWLVRQDFLGTDGRDALMLDFGVALPTNTPQTVPLWRVNIASAQVQKLPLSVPARAGCGPMNYQGSIPDVRFTDRYLYVFRQDSCGKFIARFDWHAQKPQPLLYPDQRPPVPAVPLK